MASQFGGASNFILNIIELQNTITSASGTSPIQTLTNAVAQLQEMVIYDEKRIAANTISAYNTTPIQVVDSLSLTSNATLDINGNAITGSTLNYSQVGVVGNVSSFTNYYNTVSTATTAISFQVGAPAQTPLEITTDGTVVVNGTLRLAGTGTPGLGKYLTCMDAAGTAEWVTPAIPSDGRWKEAIEPITDHETILSRIRGVRFQWSDGGAKDVGLIAQDLLPVLPEAVIEGRDGRPFMVHYHKVIPVLVETVKALKARVEDLERMVLPLQGGTAARPKHQDAY